MANSARAYCFTINNPDGPLSLDDGIQEEFVRYLVYQREKGETGTEHYQGYVELKKTCRIAALKKWGPDWARGHYEVRRGSPQQAREYATKEETRVDGPWELGEWSDTKQGKRNDLQEVVTMAKTGATKRQLAEAFPIAFIKYHRGIDVWQETVSIQKREWKTDLIVFWGDAGTGKSRWSAELAGESIYYLRRGNSNSVWWDGYEGQECVILEDFYGWIPFDTLLRIADRNPLMVDVKGGAKRFLSKKIIINSNTDWREWYDHAGNKRLDFNALARRVDVAVRLTKGEHFRVEPSGMVCGVRVESDHGGPVPEIPDWMTTHETEVELKEMELKQIENLSESDSD